MILHAAELHAHSDLIRDNEVMEEAIRRMIGTAADLAILHRRQFGDNSLQTIDLRLGSGRYDAGKAAFQFNFGCLVNGPTPESK